MTASVSASLLHANADLWERITTHPFVTATADGSLPPASFDRWLVEDHAFVVGFRRFLGQLLAIAPDEPARDLLAGGLAALAPELELFRAEAAARGLDLEVEPGPTTLGYTAYLLASTGDGFPVAATVLYGCEKAYLDAWRAVRAGVDPTSPYRAFVENWSSDAFASYVDHLGALVDRVVPDASAADAAQAFRRVVRFELRFWDAVHAGETW